MAVRGEVGSDSTVGSVSSSSALDGALDGEVGNHGLLDVKALGLGVGLQVLQQLDHVAHRLLREPALGHAVQLCLGRSPHVPRESSVRNAVSVLEDVLQVLDGSLQLKALDGSSGLVGVLEVSSQIVDSGLGSYVC